MTRFYLLRHGETTWNLEGNRYCGRTDIPLSADGRKQAARAAAALRHVDFAAAFCSPLGRSRQTAAIICQGRDLHCKIDRRLVEIDFGQWEGMTRGDIEREHPEDWNDWLRDPGAGRAGRTGESARQVCERVDGFFRDAAEAFPGRSVLVVGHNTLNRMFIAWSLGAPLGSYRRLTLDNTGISVLELSGGQVQWVRLNDTGHLRQLPRRPA